MIAHVLCVCLISGVPLTLAQHGGYGGGGGGGGGALGGGIYDGGSAQGPPQPYAFSYSSQDAEGGHSRHEQGDGSGRVSGEYSINLADGRSRTVRYTADELGYRAQIVTNELGTESKSPANVFLQSHAPTGEQAAYATAGVGGLGGHGGGVSGGYGGSGGALGSVGGHGFIGKKSSRRKA